MDTLDVFKYRRDAKELIGNLKADKLNEALSIANQLYLENIEDEWTQKALAWTLIDLIEYYISDNNLTQANSYFQNLLEIYFEFKDSFIEKKKGFLKPKLDEFFPNVKEASELSKVGNHQESLKIFNSLIEKGLLAKIHHETYGWAIYRYIKNCETELTSIQIRTFLRDYLNLSNERPSILHSMILNFVIHYSKESLGFNFYNFFLLWNPESFQEDDWKKITRNEVVYKPLAITCLKKIFKIIENQEKIKYDFDLLIVLYNNATLKFPDDIWLRREKAILLIKNK